MAGIKPLRSTHQLKTTYLRQKPPALHVKYDAAFDTFTLLLVPPETETIVHYLDNYVAFLYEPDTKEIMGIQIEAFERKFLPKHEAVRCVWKLSDDCHDLQDVGDMILAFELPADGVCRLEVRSWENQTGGAYTLILESE
jgi:hypothetical protein